MCDYNNENNLNENIPIKEEITIEESQNLEDVVKQEFDDYDEKPHKHKECSIAFKIPYNLVKHESQVNGNGSTFGCETCGKNFMTLSELKHHLITHHDKRNFKCGQCGKGFKRKTHLLSHKNSVHVTDRSFQCKECSKTFTSEKYLKSHSKYTHENVDKLHKCDRCSSAFKRKYHLSQHVIQVHGTGGKFSCEVCGRRFQQKKKFEVHMACHITENNFKCDQCFNAFPIETYLLNHKKAMHATEKPFECKVCLKTFALAKQLKYHSIKHSKERPFKCDLCLKMFKYKANFNRHIKEVHKRKGIETADDVKVEPVMIHVSD